MASWGRDDPDEFTTAQEEDEEDLYKSVNDHLLFLIDGRSNMFKSNSRGEVFIVNALRVALSVMKSKIVTSDKDTMDREGAVTSDSGSKNVYNYFPLETPSADRIIQLKDLVDRSDAASISELFTGQTGEVLCPLKEALWLCTQSFNVKGSVVHPSDFKRVWIFTNDDNPNGGDIAEQNSIVQVAKDGSETGVEISLWHMDTHEGKHFEISQFYHRLLTVDEEDGANESAYEHRVMGASGGGFDEMMDLAKRKEYKKRRLGNVRMYIAGGNERESPSTPAADVQVAVGIYKTVMPAVRPTYEWLQASTNEPALKASTMIDTSTGQVITQAESTLTSQPSLTTYIEVAGSRVPFCRDEMTNCRRLSVAAQKPDNDINHEESILKILFFVPASTLTMDMNLTAPCMISPDENSIKGSTNLFAALAHCMLQRALIGIGAFCRTKSSMPRLVALLPHLEPTDGADSTIFGLDLVTIPYSNEVRPVECMDLGGVGDEPLSNDEKNAAHNIVRAMQFADGFQYQELQSPAIQYMYAVLQAVALNQESTDWTSESDMLQPDPKGHEVNSVVFNTLKTMTGSRWDGTLKASNKRTADDTAGASIKRGKTSSSATQVDLQSLKASGDEETLSLQTVAELKEICKALAVPVSGAKKVLVERILSALK